MKVITELNAETLNALYRSGHYAYLSSESTSILYKTVAEAFAHNGCRRILDVGCYNGVLLSQIGEDDLDRYLGFDLCSEAVEEARSKFGSRGGVDFLNCSWNDLTPLENIGEFDGVYFGGVLYYIDDKVKFVTDIIERTNAKLFVIQDLATTNTRSLMTKFPCVSRYKYRVEIEVPEEEWDDDWDANTIKSRQIVVFRAVVQ